ncbi:MULTISPECIES: dihydropteroate synthase [Deefgea]|uniref:Dihydropteroate synthase n=1 Tax=Deefgea chitinilytica TaxID=570276 RepID=A0ABS2CAL4_9NEIS|nr:MULTISPECIES: dihydropteroate synthase [Deefgea]MBM5571184.1 dihydropteroate synthase [Deefgea chitinilytica]MBM9888416.1 dihydropteroate synthase [Deefgea sp. CFH1-16]
MSLFSCGRFQLDLSQPKVMGIVNVTPDSFSDGGQHDTLVHAVAHAEKLLKDGADILDVGGESTRPGAAVVAIDEEIRRVIPVIQALSSLNVPLSIDTRKPEVMRAAIEAGVDLVNDISALEGQGAIDLLASTQVGICLMHKQGDPQTMQIAPTYQDVVLEVGQYLAKRIELALNSGVAAQRIVADPGFGFGKCLEHNIALFQSIDLLGERLGLPILVGVSRKKMLGEITGQELRERMLSSVVAAVLAVQKGASIVRVHDVRETVDALKLWKVLK